MLTVRLSSLGIQPGNRVLDLGCGFGRHTFALVRRGVDVVALDAGRDEVEGTSAMLGAMALEREYDPAVVTTAALQGDAHHLPFPNSTFDQVLCSEVLEHIPDDVAVLAEMVRVLRPGGTLVVTVPRYAPERINWWLSEAYHSVPGGHIRIYRRRQLRARLEAAGVVVRHSHHAHALHSPYWWLKCLVGTTNDQNWFVRQYHKLLVWDIVKGPKTTKFLEKITSPLFGKSIIVYLEKPAS